MNKKGAFELASQMVLWIPKFLVFMLGVFVILAPISCYISRNVEDGKAESYIILRKATSCLEREGFDKEKLNNCMKQERYGIRISTEKEIITFNKENYLDKAFCDFTTFFCRNETRLINNKEFLVEVVVKSE